MTSSDSLAVEEVEDEAEKELDGDAFGREEETACGGGGGGRSHSESALLLVVVRFENGREKLFAFWPVAMVVGLVLAKMF